MLIESAHSSATPPLQNQSVMSSSPSPQTLGYDMIERLNSRVNGYRDHHKMCFLKNETTVETQNAKMKTETQRLQHQFLNNNHNNTTANNKSKAHKAVNASANQRNANKRSNAAANQCDPKCDTTEAKPTKVPKAANSRLNGANNTAKASGLSPSAHFGRNCVKFNPQSNPLDVKMKPSIGKSCMTTTTANASQPMSANTCGPEIKREIEDNSYFESVNVDAIHDILSNSCSTASAVSNGCAANGMEMIGSDVMKDLFSDSGLADDGLGGANFGDEDFIAKFLEDLNESSFNDMANSFGQQMNPQMKPLNAQQLPQQMVNHSNNTNGNNEGINCNLNVNAMNNNSNNANLILTTNQMNFNTNQLQTNSEMSSSYHPIPIQPRLQPNLIANIANRPTLHMITNNQNFTTNTVNNSNNVRNYVNVVNTGPQPQQQLLLQQITPHLTQQSLNNVNVQIQQQPQSGPAIHSRLPVNTVPRMVSVVPKPENVSVQLSIQVPQQTANANPMSSQIAQQTSGHASQAAAKLKQMAQHVQQKTHNWVVNHSNASLSQMPQQMPQQSQQQMTQSPQRLAQQPQQQRQVLVINDTQNQNQTQTYFTPQMNQQIYWQQSQQQTQQQQQQPQQHIQNHSQPQQQQIIQQNQQTFDNYWSHPQQMGQIVGQPSQQTPQQQQQQQPQQPTQQLYNNYNNNYNYF